MNAALRKRCIAQLQSASSPPAAPCALRERSSRSASPLFVTFAMFLPRKADDFAYMLVPYIAFRINSFPTAPRVIDLVSFVYIFTP
mmetsp:Transcript_18332/g.38794  ORF Transcript_18332/g.38794 Transcript_18332/m.38794 type:complete len:86 (+) Transcript_18332:2-259(+)